jgi:GNAT superfamily N-acetyltransferase
LETEEKNAFDRLESLSYLPFDSEVFGFPFFRLITDAGNSLSRDLESLGKLNLPVFGCDVKVSATDGSSVMQLQEEGFIHVCDQVTYDISTANSKFLPEVDAVELTDMDATEISSHADNFREDRLSRDSRIPNATIKRFYSKWIANSFTFPGKTIYSLQSGFCITHLKQDVLKIDLVSVLEKRKGVGSRLIKHTLARASQAKTSCVEVTTESHNAGAIKVYTRNGFREKERSSCLHLFHYGKQSSD